MKNVFKHKDEKKIEVKDNKKKILKSSFESLGVNDLVNDCIIKTYDNHEYYCFKFHYINPNGIDSSIDERNHTLMRHLINSLEKTNKVYFINEAKKNFDSNIEFYEKRLREDIPISVKNCIANRIELMKFFNNEKYVTMFIWVETKDKDTFFSMSREFLNIEMLSGERLISMLDILNNEMQ